MTNTIKMLKVAAENNGVRNVAICFHGGEPLMLPKDTIDWACTYAKENIPEAKIQFSLQTNGVLMDKEWAELMNKHDMGVGVSIDGTKEQHDQCRVDANGNGSYDRTVTGLKVLQNHNIKNGVLTVIDPLRDSVKIYRHFVDNLRIKNMDFLFPDITFQDAKNIDTLNFSKFLIDLFDEWVLDNNAKIRIRLFDSALSILMGGASYLKGIGPDNRNAYTCITIFSNVDIAPPDEFCAAGDEFMHTGMNVSLTPFGDIFKHRSFVEIEKSYNFVANRCNGCRWKNVCAGGDRIHRFSEVNGFDNPSAYCECLDKLFNHRAHFLVKTGYSIDSLISTLCTEKI